MTNYKCGGHIPDPKDKVYIPFDKSQIVGVSNNSGDVDLRPYSPSKYRHDQGQTESCVANSTTQAIFLKYVEKFGVDNAFPFSRLDLYYGARSEMVPSQTHTDAGTNICLAMDVLRRFGVCKESTCEFDASKINIPSPVMASREAFANKISGHFKIDSVGDQRVKDIILNLQNKNPVVFGTLVGSNWFNYNFNGPPIGKPSDKQGGHAMMICGWINNCFLIENSWGTEWAGGDGFALVDPAVIADGDLTSDLWVMAADFDSFWDTNKESNS
jgi:C1A family cysteine protease